MADLTSELVARIRDRHAQVLETIAASARRAGRAPDSVRLVVVTKSQPLIVVSAAIDAGVHILGENYPEEAADKIQALQGRLAQPAVAGNARPDGAAKRFSVEWHMIGHIQGRKAKLVAPHFDLIHSVDSAKLAERLDRLAGELQRKIAVLLEFNVGGEAQKHGWAASEEADWPRVLDDIGAIASLPNIEVRGLMTMPPLSANPEDARVYFRKLRSLREYLRSRAGQVPWNELSMGTSADFAVAVEEGATLVRVGEAILGPRPARENP